MRKKQNTLLAGVAALALIAGAGVAAAQQQGPQGQNGSPGMSGQSGMHAQTAKPNAGAGMAQHAQSGPATGAKAAGSAALNTKGANQPSMAQKGPTGISGQKNAGQKSAQEINRTKMGPHANKTAQSRPEHLGANAKFERNRSTARNERGRPNHMSMAKRNERGRMNTAQRDQRNLKGLQGNAAIPMQGSHVNLTSEQRTRIRETVIDARNAPRAGHVDFNIRVGTLVPHRGVRVVPVPRTLVEIDPAWRGYLYFVARDEVIIVNPRDMRIVAVLPA
jgi:hypothetical protein